MPKVLISDKLSPRAADIFRERGIEADHKVGMSPDELKEIIGSYDGLAVRSATKATPEIIQAAENLKVIGRAGIGVDNIDIPSATARGIVVMNTPYGNAVTTAEHAIAMLMTLARQIPAANASTHAGKWEKSRFMGTEVTGKTLGLVGCGNIGSVVAARAQGLAMRVLAYDPYLSEERAADLGVTRVALEELLERSDFVTLHVPFSEKTKNIIDAAAIGRMKKGARLINCARGGLVDEDALQEALEGGHLAGAALDVFATEPAKEHPLFGNENVVATPHLGAATEEAQEKVALQIAEQMSDYLLTGAVTNALNMPSISAKEAPRLKPWVGLAEGLGLFLGQLTQSPITDIVIEYEGAVAEMNRAPITSAVLAGLLRPQLADVNMVSAPVMARERGIDMTESTRDRSGSFESLVRIRIKTEERERRVAGTIFHDGRRRLVDVDNIEMDAALAPHMLFVTNEDKPGFIGSLGMTLGEGGVNIATFHLGRDQAGGRAAALIEVDEEPDEGVLEKARALPLVRSIHPLRFA